MKQIGEGIQKLSIFKNWYNDNNNNDDDDTQPPWIIVRIGMIFRRDKKGI